MSFWKGSSVSGVATKWLLLSVAETERGHMGVRLLNRFVA
jgi:hypothetical protein